MSKRIIRSYSRIVMQQFLDVLFPVHCAGCQRSGHVLCPSCIARIQPLPSPFCQQCGTPLFPGSNCKSCQYHPLKLSGQRVVSSYQEPLRKLKYYGNSIENPCQIMTWGSFRRQAAWAELLWPLSLDHQRLSGILCVQCCSFRSHRSE
jgi:hypothetical protein